MAVKPARLSVKHPEALLRELMSARLALKRTRGAAPADCPQLDALVVQLHQLTVPQLSPLPSAADPAAP